MPRSLEKAAESCKAKAGVVCDGFHPKVPLDLTKETRGKVVEFLKKVEQCGRFPQQACTRMFFLTPKNVTTERPIALMPAMVRWWEALRAPEIAKWQHKYRFEWDTIDGRNGGAERAVWRLCLRWKDSLTMQVKDIKERQHCCLTLRKPSSESACVGLDKAFPLSQKQNTCAILVLRIPAEGAVRRLCGRGAPDHDGHSPWVKVELLAPAHCVAGRSE